VCAKRNAWSALLRRPSEIEIDKLLSIERKRERRQELLGMETAALKSLCDAAGVDTVVKEVLIERLLTHEAEFGTVEPAAKRARTKQ